MEHELWYLQPARDWLEALPIGNGSLGAMVFGGTETERLQLNLDTLWSGYPRANAPEDLAGFTLKAQKLALSGQLHQAQQVLEQHVLGDFHESYLPMGDMLIREGLSGRASHYRRSLDLETGFADTTYTKGGVSIFRRVFASFPAKALVLHWQASEPVDVVISLSSQLRHKVSSGFPLRVTGLCPSRVEPNYVSHEDPVRYETDRPGIRFAFGVHVNTDGKQDLQGDALHITGATRMTVVLMARSSFTDCFTDPNLPDWDGEQRLVEELLNTAFNLESLQAAHLWDYRQLEQACRFHLDCPPSPLPTDRRILAFDGSDLGLYALLFRYGRYLLIASSREGSQPANLQGIWNRELRAPWSSNYTININTQMNYWPAFSAGLADCALPLVQMVKELSQTGAEVARAIHGAPGWCAHHNVDLWRNARPVGNHQAGSACYGYWPMGGVWLCRAVWEYADYTGDMEFLRQTALPVLQGAADFVLSQLTENARRQLVVCPMTSPENTFLLDGKTLAVAESAAMGQSLCEDLLRMVQTARQRLGMEVDKAIETALSCLKPLEIGRDGRLLEWDVERTEAEFHHRHVSHLYALYPGRSIRPGSAVGQACKQSLIARGDEGTGWSLAWKVSLWARLGDGNHALSLLSMQLRPAWQQTGQGGGSYPNLFCAHPPFQIDGNLGAAAGMLEMLLQQQGQELHLLPALPENWSKGSIHGIRAPGGLSLDLVWDRGRLTQARVTAGKPGQYRLMYRGKPYTLDLGQGESALLEIGKDYDLKKIRISIKP